MRKLIIAILMMVAINVNAGMTAGFQIEQGAQSTESYYITDKAVTGSRVAIGYEAFANDKIGADVNLSLGLNKRREARVETNLIFNVDEKISIHAGLNNQRTLQNKPYGISLKSGMGYQAGVEYKLDEKFSLDAQLTKTNQEVGATDFEGSSDLQQNIVSVGIKFRF